MRWQVGGELGDSAPPTCASWRADKRGRADGGKDSGGCRKGRKMERRGRRMMEAKWRSRGMKEREVGVGVGGGR